MRGFRGPLATVRRLARLDGRSRIFAAKEAGGEWVRQRRPTRLTAEETAWLREVHVSQVVLSRGGRRATLLLSWI